MRIEDGIGYAIDVTKGNISACHNIRLACQRFLDFMEDKKWEYEFVPEYVEHFIKFVSYIKHTKGPDAGKPLILEPFQIMIVCAIYGFRHKKDHTKRMTTDVIIFIPRKAGKSTISGVIALYELQFGETGAEVFTLATNREQATIVFDACKGMIERMPPSVAKAYDLSKYEISKTGDSQSMMRALSRDNKKSGDGKNASCAIIDEAAQIVDLNEVKKELGANADDRINAVTGWAKANLDPENYAALREATSGRTAAAAFKVIEAAINKTRQVSLPRPGADVVAAQPTGLDGVKAMMEKRDANGRLLYMVDQEYRKKVEAANMAYHQSVANQ